MIMKRLIVIIVILAIVFVGMIGYKKIAIHNNRNINIQEISKIETYITKIYMWKEITTQALPCFEEINQADDRWVWEAVKKNLEEFELTYEQIQTKAKELFGEKLTKQFPREGTPYLTYDEQTSQYYATGMGLDQQEDMFLLNTINIIQNGYEVEIIEYLEDYSQTSNREDNAIIIRNTKEEEIGKISNTEEEQAKEIVKNNSDKFSKKKLVLRIENENLYVEKVYESH